MFWIPRWPTALSNNFHSTFTYVLNDAFQLFMHSVRLEPMSLGLLVKCFNALSHYFIRISVIKTFLLWEKIQNKTYAEILESSEQQMYYIGLFWMFTIAYCVNVLHTIKKNDNMKFSVYTAQYALYLHSEHRPRWWLFFYLPQCYCNFSIWSVCKADTCKALSEFNYTPHSLFALQPL